MKMSCNGCRVLRKGCDQDCTLRSCLQWIDTPESQANATLFLAKFYGRAGLLNLINGGSPHLRPAIFRSLLYDACGRIINPIYGSVGLMWSGNWHHCQAAVDSVLNGSPIMQLPCNAAAAHHIMPLKGGDIRHLSAQPNGTHRVRTRNRSKRSSSGRGKANADFAGEYGPLTVTGSGELNGAPSHDSFSVETVEEALVNRAEPERAVRSGGEIVLELTIGVNPGVRHHLSTVEEMGDEQSVGGI